MKPFSSSVAAHTRRAAVAARRPLVSRQLLVPSQVVLQSNGTSSTAKPAATVTPTAAAPAKDAEAGLKTATPAVSTVSAPGAAAAASSVLKPHPHATVPRAAAAAAAGEQHLMARLSGPTHGAQPLDFASFLGGRLRDVHDHGHVKVMFDSDVLAWVVLDTKGKSANALNEPFMRSLAEAIQKSINPRVADGRVRGVVFASAKKNFIVGADVDMLYPMTDKGKVEAMIADAHKVLSLVQEIKCPTVSAIAGMALGGGLEFAMCTSHRFVAADAQLGLPEIMLGLLPGAGGTVRLQKFIGLDQAAALILAGKNVKGEKARKMGLADGVCEFGDRWPGDHRFLNEVRTFTGKLIDKNQRREPKPRGSPLKHKFFATSLGRTVVAQQSLKTLNKMTKGKYLGPYKALESILYAATHSEEEALRFEAMSFADVCVTPEAKNQIALFHLTEGCKKLEANTGVSDKDIPAIDHVGVIGAGVMGSGIVHAFLKKGFKVYLKDLNEDVLKKGVQTVESIFAPAVKRKRMTKTALKESMDRLKTGTTDDLWPKNGTGILVEAAVERMDIKQQMVKDLEAKGVLKNHVFASNTSSLSILEMSKGASDPSQVVGMHFFNPVDKMLLVEVVVGKNTSQAAAALVYKLAAQLGKYPLIVGDNHGFLVNRILGAYICEAGRILQERADLRKVDKLVLDFGMPMGPYRLLDEVGIDVAEHISPILAQLGPRFEGNPKISEMVKHGALGKKAGKGFYVYNDLKKAPKWEKFMPKAYRTKKEAPNTALAKMMGMTPDATYDYSDVVDRMVLVMINEAAMILSESLVKNAEAVDLGMVFGTGFAPARGGLLQHADQYHFAAKQGAPAVVARLESLQARYGPRFAPCPLLKEMAAKNQRFYPDRPDVPYQTRKGYPRFDAAATRTLTWMLPKQNTGADSFVV
eukprot:TRINITY_DN32545_c0_g1_i1.p1 TRINITY_DN32545_c0_g1~~TRINITY_DN32545_c0_g1_i1.p1  ORF type:complete len:954 (-),score=283.21 TRINITY_DN32545_c0_g1_i1:670-3438(-)